MFICLCKAFPWDSSIMFQVKAELLVQRKSFVSHERVALNPRQPLRGGASESINFPGKCII